jgi:hypothetical protein
MQRFFKPRLPARGPFSLTINRTVVQEKPAEKGGTPFAEAVSEKLNANTSTKAVFRYEEQASLRYTSSLQQRRAA